MPIVEEIVSVAVKTDAEVPKISDFPVIEIDPVSDEIIPAETEAVPEIPISKIEPVSPEPELVSVEPESVSVEPEPVSVEPEPASVEAKPVVSDPVVEPESLIELESVIEAVPLAEPVQVETEPVINDIKVEDVSSTPLEATELGINKNPKDEIIYIRKN